MPLKTQVVKSACVLPPPRSGWGGVRWHPRGWARAAGGTMGSPSWCSSPLPACFPPPEEGRFRVLGGSPLPPCLLTCFPLCCSEFSLSLKASSRAGGSADFLEKGTTMPRRESTDRGLAGRRGCSPGSHSGPCASSLSPRLPRPDPGPPAAQPAPTRREGPLARMPVALRAARTLRCCGAGRQMMGGLPDTSSPNGVQNEAERTAKGKFSHDDLAWPVHLPAHMSRSSRKARPLCARGMLASTG